MWDNIEWVGVDNWIAEAIKEGTCIAVTDGSYMKELYPSIHLGMHQKTRQAVVLLPGRVCQCMQLPRGISWIDGNSHTSSGGQ
jgi:hypothetical protein